MTCDSAFVFVAANVAKRISVSIKVFAGIRKFSENSKDIKRLLQFIYSKI